MRNEAIKSMVVFLTIITIGGCDKNSTKPNTQIEDDLYLRWDYQDDLTLGWAVEVRRVDGKTVLTFEWADNKPGFNDPQKPVTVSINLTKERADKFWKIIQENNPLELSDSGHLVIDGGTVQTIFRIGEQSNEFVIHVSGGGLDSARHKALYDLLREVQQDGGEIISNIGFRLVRRP